MITEISSRDRPRSSSWLRAVVAAIFLLLPGAVPDPALGVEPAEVTVEEGARRVRISTGAARVDVRLRRYQLTLHDGDRRRRLTREDRAGGLFYERDGRVHELSEVSNVEVLPDGVDLTVQTDEGAAASVTLRFLTQRTLEVTLTPPIPETVDAFGDRWRSRRSEVIYGLTERLRDSPLLAPGVIDVPVDDVRPQEVGSLDRRGETVEMLIRPTFSVYAPFYQSSRGYGLSVAGTTIGVFDVAATDERVVSFRFEAGSKPDSQRLVFHLFVGPEHETILDEYTNLVGRPFVPPDWAFSHWRWRDELMTAPPALLDGTLVNAEVAEDVLMYEQHGIPPGVYLLDRPVLEGNFGFARWAFDTTRLPNIQAMLDSLVQRGYYLATWSSTWACGDTPGDNGAEAQTLGYLAPNHPGAPVCSNLGGNFILDVTNPDARTWWRDKIAAFMQQYGIRAIKLDRGEEHIPSEAGDIWADGRTGREVRNAYPSLQAQIHHDALQSVFAGGDFLVLSRPGYTGTPQFTIFWGGDITASENFGSGVGTDLGLRSAIISQQRAAFIGVPIWGSDTGGYYGFKDREVFARWIEFSAFSGIMEIGGVGSHEPWAMPTEPAFDTEMIDIYRRYTQLRETLLPYIVAAAEEGARGVPMARPMAFFDRRDRRLQDLWDQYMFGPDLMVAPVWRIGQRSREVYFPRGKWRSYWDPTEVYTGRRTITVDVPLDQIPVFVREGALVPGPG